MSHFTSQRGNYCTKLLLVDELGDEIICMLFEKMGLYFDILERDAGQLKFTKGRTYIFANGEVTRD